MARLLLTCARGGLIPRSSPLEALRVGHIERAWRLADLTDEGRRYLWRLLLAWELHEVGKPAEALACLEVLRGQPLLDFKEGEGSCAAFMLMNLFDLDREIVADLPQAMMKVGDYFPAAAIWPHSAHSQLRWNLRGR